MMRSFPLPSIKGMWSKLALTVSVAALLLALFLLRGDQLEELAMRASAPPARAHRGDAGKLGVVVPSNGNRRRRRSALAWLANGTELPACGSWPTDMPARHALTALKVETSALGWACIGYRESLEMSRRELRRGQRLTPETCARWCESARDPSLATEGSWCCQWRAAGGNGDGECEWTDGVAAVVHNADGPAPKRAGPRRALAYEACSLESQFVLFTDGCVRDPSGHLGDVAALDASDCALECEAVAGCDYFGYATTPSPNGSGAAGAGDELVSACELRATCTVSEVPRAQATEFYARANTPIGIAPFLDAAAADDGPTMVGAGPSAPKTTVLRPSGWPTQVGLALGRVVDPGRAKTAHACDDGACSRRARRARRDGRHLVGAPLACGNASGDATRVADAMLFGSDYPASCAQICLPLEYMSVAMENGVRRGWCADNGCRGYAVTRIYGDVSYDLFDCACPTSNASALYACDPPHRP